MPSADRLSPGRPGHVVCVDFGSTFTKAALVDLTEGRIAASASHPTTIGTDVLDGYDACLASLVAQDARAATAEVLACSSAGGGLRIAVVGNEELVTAEAGRRVALSSGGKVVAVVAASGRAPGDGHYAQVLAAGPARRRAADRRHRRRQRGGAARAPPARSWPPAGAARWSWPATSTPATRSPRSSARCPTCWPTTWCPGSACSPRTPRGAAIREVFLAHVIGGKHLSARADFTAMVRGATPDVVLTGVELLARGLDDEHPGAGDVVVVDVGGATTDVHSVVEIDPDTGYTEGGLAREVVAATPVTRTVEGDLGMRWSAVTTVAEAGLDDLAEAAAARQADPGFLPATDADRDADEAIARAAVGLALRRHAGRSRVVVSPEGRVVERTGRTCARSTCWSARAACSGTGGRGWRRGCWPAAPAPTSRAAGSCRARPGSWSTPTTCSRPPGCWPSGTPWRRTGWCGASSPTNVSSLCR